MIVEEEPLMKRKVRSDGKEKLQPLLGKENKQKLSNKKEVSKGKDDSYFMNEEYESDPATPKAKALNYLKRKHIVSAKSHFSSDWVIRI